jgi:hypothetical protein
MCYALASNEIFPYIHLSVMLPRLRQRQADSGPERTKLEQPIQHWLRHSLLELVWPSSSSSSKQLGLGLEPPTMEMELELRRQKENREWPTNRNENQTSPRTWDLKTEAARVDCSHSRNTEYGWDVIARHIPSTKWVRLVLWLSCLRSANRFCPHPRFQSDRLQQDACWIC